MSSPMIPVATSNNIDLNEQSTTRVNLGNKIIP